MQKLESIRELLAVAKGFEEYVYRSFTNEGLIFCHPIVEALFLPRGLEFIPENRVFDVKVSNVFLTSIDGENWGYNFNQMIDVVSNGGNFFIADLKLNVYLSVEYYMLDDIIRVLNSDIEGLVNLSNFKWKDGELGELAYFTLDEFLQ